MASASQTPRALSVAPPKRAAGSSLPLTGALALLAIGALHLHQYLGAGHSALPTFGTLFVLDIAAALAVAGALLLPVERLSARLAAVAPLAPAPFALLGAAMAGTSLFGFLGQGYSAPIVVALVSEGIAAAALLAPALARRTSERMR